MAETKDTEHASQMLTMLRSKYSNLTVQGVFDAVEAVMTTSVTGMLKRKIFLPIYYLSKKEIFRTRICLKLLSKTLTGLTMMMK